jgi:hypothetical protein
MPRLVADAVSIVAGPRAKGIARRWLLAVAMREKDGAVHGIA